MAHAQDHFSGIAAEYNAGRVTYPKELHEYLSSVCMERLLVWDCATGSGQAAIDLSSRFNRVIATDISDSLLSLAPEVENVAFRCAPAESSGIEPNCVDLVVVAQAIHWFDYADFWKEVSRVLKPNGILAFWGYVWPVVDERIDILLDTFRENIASCWPHRSQDLQGFYEGVDAPFERIKAPDLQIEENWTASDYLAHLGSWSATRYFQDTFGESPLDAIARDVECIWGRGLRTVRWQLVLKAYQKAEQAVPPKSDRAGG